MFKRSQKKGELYSYKRKLHLRIMCISGMQKVSTNIYKFVMIALYFKPTLRKYLWFIHIQDNGTMNEVKTDLKT